MPAPPWRFSDAELSPPDMVATPGEHNFEILAGLGLSDAEIKELEAEGVLTPAANA